MSAQLDPVPDIHLFLCKVLRDVVETVVNRLAALLGMHNDFVAKATPKRALIVPGNTSESGVVPSVLQSHN